MTSCSSLKRKTVRTVIFWGLIYFMGIPAFSQTQLTPNLVIFEGAEFHYRDIFYNKMYEIVVNLAPGVKWHIGNQWQLAGQAIIPVYNDYGDYYKNVRLNMAVLSKEWDWKGRQFL